MATERGTGHLLLKKRGPAGQSSSAYGGSLTLTGASVKNHRMGRLLHVETGQMNREWEVSVKTNYRRRLSLQCQLEQLEQAKRTATYLDGNSRGHPVDQWDSYTCRKMMPVLQQSVRPSEHNAISEPDRRDPHRDIPRSRPKQFRKGVPRRKAQKPVHVHEPTTGSELPKCVATRMKLSNKSTTTNSSQGKGTNIRTDSVETDSRDSGSTGDRH